MGTNAQRGGGKVFCLKSTARPGFPYGDERKMAQKKPQQTHNRLHGKAAKTANFCRFLLGGLFFLYIVKKDGHRKKDRTSGKKSSGERLYQFFLRETIAALIIAKKAPGER